jgi:hypothetical protein
MGDYNHTIARSRSFSAPGQPASELDKVRLDKSVLDYYSKHADLGVEKNCIVRTANRLLSERGWANGICLPLLAAKVSERLAIDLEEEGRNQLMTVVYSFYSVSKSHIEAVNIIS